jgi:hypothetical protein
VSRCRESKRRPLRRRRVDRDQHHRFHHIASHRDGEGAPRDRNRDFAGAKLLALVAGEERSRAKFFEASARDRERASLGIGLRARFFARNKRGRKVHLLLYNCVLDPT